MKYFLLVLLLLCPRAWGDDLLECTDRGRIALDTANAIKDGLPVESIQYSFPFATSEDMPQVREWVKELKKEVVEALKEKGSPELAAQQIMERCAYEYGKKRRKTGKESTT